MPREGPEALPEDRIRFRHMIDAAKDALAFAEGRSRDDLLTDRMFRRALVNALQEIGEAAAKTTDLGRARAPGVPWGQIVQMRHILVHVYFAISEAEMWRVVEEDLVPFIQMLEAALSDWPEEPLPPIQPAA